MASENHLYWSPIPSRLPPDIREAFAEYSLQREISQTNLVFYTFGIISASNLAIDLVLVNHDFLLLNSFFLFLAIGAILAMRHIADHRLLSATANLVAFLIIAAIVIAKQDTRPEDWFVYLADLMIIAVITLAIPINLLVKLTYATLIVTLDVVSLQAADFNSTIDAGVVLILSGMTAYSAIIYYKMQQAHFEVFLSLQREKAINEELRNTEIRLNTLQGLLPVCANCKKIQDDAGDWSQIDEYIHTHGAGKVSHGICPDCAAKLYPELALQQDETN